MRVITEKRIWEAKEQWPHSANALDQWYRQVKRNSPVKEFYPAPMLVLEGWARARPLSELLYENF